MQESQTSSSLSSSSFDQDTFQGEDETLTKMVLPYCKILENPESFTSQTIQDERRRIVRRCMNQFLTLSRRKRPSDAEIILLARMLSTKYPILRDRPNEGLRDNFNNMTLFLRRRMYNVTPATTNRGRKKKCPSTVAHLENIDNCASDTVQKNVEMSEFSSEEYQDKEVITSSNTNTDLENCTQTATGSDVENGNGCTVLSRPLDALDKDLQKATTTTPMSSLKQLIRLTAEFRAESMMKVPEKKRANKFLELYTVMKNSELLIYNMKVQIPEQDLETNLKMVLTSILDVATEMCLLKAPRSALKTEDDKMLVSLSHLCEVISTPKALNNMSGLCLVQSVKSEESWKDVALQHRGNSAPWLLHSQMATIGLVLMCGEKAVAKCGSVCEGVLALLGLFYAAMIPYPKGLNAGLLFLQKEVLWDEIHPQDDVILQRARERYDKQMSAATTSDVSKFF